MRLYARTIGIACAEPKITLINTAFNMQQPIFHEHRGSSTMTAPKR